MVTLNPALPSHIDVRVGGTPRRAVPVLLRGHEASFVMDEAPAERQDVALVLDWNNGKVTELAARVRSVDGDGRIAHVDVLGVEGDWAPFMEYLGRIG